VVVDRLFEELVTDELISLFLASVYPKCPLKILPPDSNISQFDLACTVIPYFSKKNLIPPSQVIVSTETS